MNITTQQCLALAPSVRAIKFVELQTKKSRLEYIRNALMTSDRWMLKGLITIFNNQTEDEQSDLVTKVNNGIGFTGIDAEILSSFALRAISRGGRQAILDLSRPVDAHNFLSAPCVAILRKKMQKYACQLSRIADNTTPIVKKPKSNA
jgi:hypothetical protein